MPTFSIFPANSSWGVSQERIIGTFQSPLSNNRLPPEPEPEEEPAQIEFGKPSRFQFSAANPLGEQQGGGFSVGGSSSQGEEPTNNPIIVYTEVSRQEETVRVNNPEDANQYVDDARMTTVTFSRTDGVLIQLVFNNPPDE